MKKALKSTLLIGIALCQQNLFAQMQSLPLNTSSERNISVTTITTPIKSLFIDNGSNEIISLVCNATSQ